jgi:DNA-binding transcriptional ArsR family regulator
VKNTSRRSRASGSRAADKNADCATVLKALGDKNRLTVVRELMGGAKHVYELNEVIKIEPNLLSHHLKVLRQAEIVQSERDGKAVLYSLAPGVMKKARGNISLDFKGCALQFK